MKGMMKCMNQQNALSDTLSVIFVAFPDCANVVAQIKFNGLPLANVPRYTHTHTLIKHNIMTTDHLVSAMFCWENLPPSIHIQLILHTLLVPKKKDFCRPITLNMVTSLPFKICLLHQVSAEPHHVLKEHSNVSDLRLIFKLQRQKFDGI